MKIKDIPSAIVSNVRKGIVVPASPLALDENRKPTPVPPLVPANDKEKVIIERARMRRLHKQKIEEELKQAEEIKD